MQKIIFLLLALAANPSWVAASDAHHLAFLAQPPSVVYNDVVFQSAVVVGFQNENGELDPAMNHCGVTLSLVAQYQAGALLGTTAKTSVSGVADFSGHNLRVHAPDTGGSFRLLAEASGPGCRYFEMGISDPFVVGSGY